MTIGERELNLTLPPDPRAVAEARETVEATLTRARPEVSQDVRLLVSELVTNALRHGNLSPRGSVFVHLRATADSVRVEVSDQGEGFDPSAVPGPRETSGWGLYLVEQLSARWGVQANDGTHVWFELDRPFEQTA